MKAIGRGSHLLSRRRVVAGALAQTACHALPFAATRAAAQAAIATADQAIDSLMPATPEAARAMAARSVFECENIAQQGNVTIKELAASDRALAEGARQISALQDRKGTVISQLRSGYYCSQCKRSKVEIEEQEHISFEEHLRRVNGHQIPAPESLVQQKAAEFDAKIAAEQQEQNLRREHRDKLKLFNENLQLQFNAGILFWKTAILTEYGLVETRYKKKVEIETKNLEAAKDALTQMQHDEFRLLQGLDGHDPSSLDRLRENQDAQALQSERIDEINKSLASRKRNYTDTVQVVTQNRDRESAALIQAARLLTGNEPYQMPALPNISVSYDGWDTSVSDQQAGIKFQFGKVVAAGLTSTFDRDSHSMETVAFVQLFGKVRAFAGSRTDMESGSVVPTGGFESHPAQPPANFESDTPHAGDWHIDLPRP